MESAETKTMTAPKNTEDLKKTDSIKQRFLTAGQSKGSLSKSTLADFLLGWYRFAGVEFSAIDADAQHRTLSNRYPEEVMLFDVTASEDEFGTMLSGLPASPAVVMDCPAQFTDKFIAFAEHYRMLDAFARSGTRMTLFIFASDDQDARDSAAVIVEYFGDRADFVLVENEARFKSVEFKKTGLYDLLASRQAPTILIPRISVVSLNAWADLEQKHERSLSVNDVALAPELPFLAKMELGNIRNRLFAQFEDCARLLLPDERLIKNRVVREAPRVARGRANRFNNPLLQKSNRPA
jgi:hypothetical protein